MRNRAARTVLRTWGPELGEFTQLSFCPGSLLAAKELLSFSNLSKLYSAMDYREQDIIAESVGTSRKTYKNHLHCLANLRNKVAHAGRLYNVVFNPPVMLGRLGLRANQDVSQDSLFAYLLVLARRLPDVDYRIKLLDDVCSAISRFSDCVHLPLIGFPDDYRHRFEMDVSRHLG